MYFTPTFNIVERYLVKIKVDNIKKLWSIVDLARVLERSLNQNKTFEKWVYCMVVRLSTHSRTWATDQAIKPINQ